MARNSAEDNNLDIIIVGNALISFVMELFFTIVGVALSSAICVATDKKGNNLTFSYHNFSLILERLYTKFANNFTRRIRNPGE